MSPETIAKDTLPPLSKTQQMEMDEDVRTRMQTKSISHEVFTKDRPRYQRWFSKRLGWRLHITKSKRVQGDVVGEYEMRQGLSVKFMGGELILDRKDPYFDLITKRLREHHYFDLKHIICVDDLDAEEKKRTSQKTIGVSQRHQLKQIGIMSQKQQDDILKVLNVTSTKEFNALAKVAKGLKEENKELKDSRSTKTLVDLQAENKRLKDQAQVIADLEAENKRLKEAGNGRNTIQGSGGASS